MQEKIKLVVAFALMLAGIAGYYYLHDSAAVVRVGAILLGIIAAVGMGYTSQYGKTFFGFAQDSVAEAKRVTWPTRKETMQTTGVVILFAVTMALFLWAVDASLMVLVNKLMGRGE